MLPVGGSDTVGTGVAAADYDDVPVVREDLPLHRVAGDNLVLLWQKLHREVDALKITAGHGKVARKLGTAREHDGVVVLEQGLRIDVHPDMLVHAELHALALH